jgi:gamma-glutamylcyclotransferase (GGCT)/AIG2-like uncharacterized protein YtfP
MTDARELVFVYGTLRKEGTNHFRMDGAEFQGRAVVKGRLYQFDWYPGLVLDPEAGEVAGEVYEVSSGQLAALDEFEGGEYRRVEAEVMRIEPYFRQLVWVWEYVGEVQEERRIRDGDWLEGLKPKVLPLFLWVAWSPGVLLLGVLGFAAIAAPSEAAEPAWLEGMWYFVLVLVLVPLVMAGGGVVAMKRGERPRLMGIVAIMLGSTALALIGVVALRWWLAS